MDVGDSSVIGPKCSPSPHNSTPPQSTQPTDCPLPAEENPSPQQEILDNRPRKKKSLVWNHFVKIVIKGEQKAKCLHCHRLFSGNSKNGTSHLIDHMTRRCIRRSGQVGPRQKLFSFNHRRDSTIRLDNHVNHSPVCLDDESEHVLCTPNGAVEINVQEPKLGTPCGSDGHEHVPLCVDYGASQCIEQENGCSSNLVVKATYKEDTVRFDFSPTSSVNELEKEVAKNLKLELSKFKIKYQDEDKEWMLMTMDSHLNYVLSLSRSSGSNVVRLLITDL